MYRHGREEIEAVARVLASGQWSRFGDVANGCAQEAVRFEQEWAQTVRSPHSCLVNSGTSALMCCYAGLGLGPGDEVIVPGYTWIATAQAPLIMGVIPIIVDIDESLTIDPDAVERAITPRTRAICPAHVHGFACDMDRLRAIAAKHRLLLIEDACTSEGGRWSDGQHLGAIGDMGAFSFAFSKVISCGVGGAFVAKQRKHFERALIFHDGGVNFRAHAKEIGEDFFCGLNLRGNEIMASLLRVQLTRLTSIIADLHTVRKRIVGRLGAQAPLMPLRGGESVGTGGYIGLQFTTGEQAAQFCAALKMSGAPASALRQIDSGRFVYRNWEAVLQQKGAWTASANPFLHPANIDNRPHYSPDMLPRTLSILERTVLVAMNPDWNEATCDQVANALVSSAL